MKTKLINMNDAANERRKELAKAAALIGSDNKHFNKHGGAN